MSKEVLLALLYNATVQLNEEIIELTEDINYTENKLAITKKKRICDIVKKNYTARKKKKKEELNEFFSQYIKFLLDNRKDSVKSITLEKLQGDLCIGKLMENINKTNINEEQNEKILKDMYEKRNILKDILLLIKENDLDNLNFENSQNGFSDLMSKLKNINAFIEEDYNEIKNKEKVSLQTKIIKNEKNINYLEKKNLNYLSNDDYIISKMNGNSISSSASLICLNSEKTIGIEQVDKLSNSMKESTSVEIKKNLLENKKEKKVDNYINNKKPITNTKLLEKEKSSIIISKTHHESLNKFLLNDKLKENSFGKLFSKLNLTKKAFSNTETKLKVSFMDNKELNKERIFHAMEKSQKNSILTLKNQNKEKSNNFSSTLMKNSQNSNLKNNSRISVKCLSSSINERSINVNKNKVSETGDKRGRSFNSSSFGSFSSSSNSHLEKYRSDSNTFYRRKKYLFKINKNGKGVFSINREEKSSKNIYDFEIIYEDPDFDESTRLNNKKGKNKKILHFSFVKRGKKIYDIENLYISDNELIKNFDFYNNKNMSCYDKESSHNEKKSINILEKKIEILKKQNSRRKYELTRIIDDIKHKNLKENENLSYNSEFVETNRLRGLYLHLLEGKNELERDRNFYKNELEKLQKDVKNSTLPISEFIKEEKKILLEREKEFYKKEKNFLKKKNELKKTIIDLQNDLELAQEKLIKEIEINDSLNNVIKDHKNILEKKEAEKKKADEENEYKINVLNDDYGKLKETIIMEKEQKEKLIEEVNIYLNKIEKLNEEIVFLKKSDSFNNFRKLVLERVNKTDDDIKYLAKLLELLTEELEKKKIKENLINKQLVNMEQKCVKNKKFLNISKKKLRNKKNKIESMKKEISHLNNRNMDLIKIIEYLKLQKFDNTNIEKKNKEYYTFVNEEKKKKNEELIDKKFNNLKNSDVNNLKITCNLNKNKKEQFKNEQSFTSFSDESSLFLCNADTKRENSFEELMNNINNPKHIS